MSRPQLPDCGVFHHHPHDGEHDHSHSLESGHRPGRRGHNGPGAAQWQTPHVEGDRASQAPENADLDLIEAAFVEGFSNASDALSFLRLGHVPVEARDAADRALSLLRVETQTLTDIGALTPRLGGGAYRYDPLPGRLASQRRKLAFVYFDGSTLHSLSLAEARTLKPV
jgi:hypothetical protein